MWWTMDQIYCSRHRPCGDRRRHLASLWSACTCCCSSYRKQLDSIERRTGLSGEGNHRRFAYRWSEYRRRPYRRSVPESSFEHISPSVLRDWSFLFAAWPIVLENTVSRSRSPQEESVLRTNRKAFRHGLLFRWYSFAGCGWSFGREIGAPSV